MRFSSFWVSGGPPNFLVAATGLVDLTCHVCSTGLPSPKCLPAPRVLEEETQQPSLTHSDVASSKTASSKKKKKILPTSSPRLNCSRAFLPPAANAPAVQFTRAVPTKPASGMKTNPPPPPAAKASRSLESKSLLKPKV